MSAMSGDDGDPDDWDDEWNQEDWQTLSVVDREQRNEDSWLWWGLRLFAIAMVLPLVLGLLALALIVIF